MKWLEEQGWKKEFLRGGQCTFSRGRSVGESTPWRGKCGARPRAQRQERDMEGGRLDGQSPKGGHGISVMSMRHLWVNKTWGCLRASTVTSPQWSCRHCWSASRHPCSGNLPAQHMKAASWGRRSLHLSIERGSVTLQAAKNSSASHSCSPV